MFRGLRRLLRRIFTRREVVHFIPRLPVGLELSDGDRAALYGWPDYYVQEINIHDYKQ